MTKARVVSDSNVVTFKNHIINANFDIWQRGPGPFASTTTGQYVADRFNVFRGTTGGYSCSRVAFTPGNEISGYESEYFLRLNVSVAGDLGIRQAIEDVRTFAGQKITVSFWAKASVSMVLDQTFALQVFGTGGSAQVATAGVPVDSSNSSTVTTSWKRFSVTLNVPSISGKTIGTNSSLQIRIDVNNTFLGDFDIWGIQAEEGSIATPLEQRPPGFELALCQRYYQRINQVDYESLFAIGLQTSTTAATFVLHLPVQLRTIPSSVIFSNVKVGDQTAWSLAATLSSFGRSTVSALSLLTTFTTQGASLRPIFLQGTGTAPFTSYNEVSAEL